MGILLDPIGVVLVVIVETGGYRVQGLSDHVADQLPDAFIRRILMEAIPQGIDDGLTSTRRCAPATARETGKMWIGYSRHFHQENQLKVNQSGESIPRDQTKLKLFCFLLENM